MNEPILSLSSFKLSIHHDASAHSHPKARLIPRLSPAVGFAAASAAIVARGAKGWGGGRSRTCCWPRKGWVIAPRRWPRALGLCLGVLVAVVALRFRSSLRVRVRVGVSLPALEERVPPTLSRRGSSTFPQKSQDGSTGNHLAERRAARGSMRDGFTF